MTLDLMNINNQSGGRRRRRRSGQSKSRQANRGGTFLADASIPAGLFLLHKYLKDKKSRKSNNKSRKSSKKRTRRRR